MMRVRINFDKTEAMRFTGHLDLYRTWERTLRRAGLPLAYSQGFKPHPRLQIAAALPLGFTSSNDLMDIWLEDELPISFIQSCILAALPPGLQLNSLNEVPLNQPALQSLLTASEYQITFLESIPDLEQRVKALTNHSSILIERRGKKSDLRPLILSIQILIHNPDEQQRLKTLLRTDSTIHARPDELIKAMGIPPEKVLFHRLRLQFNQELT